MRLSLWRILLNDWLKLLLQWENLLIVGLKKLSMKWIVWSIQKACISTKCCSELWSRRG